MDRQGCGHYALPAAAPSAASPFSTDVRAAAQQQEAVLRRLDAEVKEPALPTRSIVDLGLIKVGQIYVVVLGLVGSADPRSTICVHVSIRAFPSPNP